MKNVLEYNGYSGSVEFSADDDVFFGKITGIMDVVTFEADTVVKLKKAFKEAVEDYIKTCKDLNKDSDKEFKGSFNVKVKPKIHRPAAMNSAALRMSLNQFVEKALEKEVLK